eukprot:TRINITY_DN12736_c0_g1_i2.p1 TRINITY_DN12736_c0_g1~~TRINITY_DN12736_c0_g1_i2.p1  ORF type:complete len:478 (-),score=74.19 TRINITY_DN12736_c0_g1_i2:31-1464(-)
MDSVRAADRMASDGLRDLLHSRMATMNTSIRCMMHEWEAPEPLAKANVEPDATAAASDLDAAPAAAPPTPRALTRRRESDVRGGKLGDKLRGGTVAACGSSLYAESVHPDLHALRRSVENGDLLMNDALQTLLTRRGSSAVQARDLDTPHGSCGTAGAPSQPDVGTTVTSDTPVAALRLRSIASSAPPRCAKVPVPVPASASARPPPPRRRSSVTQLAEAAVATPDLPQPESLGGFACSSCDTCSQQARAFSHTLKNIGSIIAAWMARPGEAVASGDVAAVLLKPVLACLWPWAPLDLCLNQLCFDLEQLACRERGPMKERSADAGQDILDVTSIDKIRVGQGGEAAPVVSERSVPTRGVAAQPSPATSSSFVEDVSESETLEDGRSEQTIDTRETDDKIYCDEHRVAHAEAGSDDDSAEKHTLPLKSSRRGSLRSRFMNVFGDDDLNHFRIDTTQSVAASTLSWMLDSNSRCAVEM